MKINFGNIHFLSLHLLVVVCVNSRNEGFYTNECPSGCICPEPQSLECHDLDIMHIPSEWPTNLEKIIIKNATINTIKKNAFRRFHNLEELSIEKCLTLEVIDKFAFKGLQKLKLLKVIGNPKVRELSKYSFSAIGNDNPLRITIKNNGVEKIEAFAFKNMQNLRELKIDESCFSIESNGLSGIDRLDFLTLRGVCVLAKDTFANSSRIYNLVIVDSTLNFKSEIFAALSHVSQIQIHKCRIGKIEENAFKDMLTVGDLQIQQNYIGKIAARAFVGMENVGVLLFSYNNVKEPLDSPECILHSAQKLVFTENTVHCSCDFQWIQYHEDQTMLSENYCDSGEAYKSISLFKPLGCAPMPITTEPPNEVIEITPPSLTDPFTINNDKQVSSVHGVEVSASTVNFRWFNLVYSLFALLICKLS